MLLTSAGVLSGAGLTVGGIGSAVIAPDIVGRVEAAFPITGGDLTGLAGTIEHDGSGLSLSSGPNTLSLENFLIDTTSLLLFADASLNGGLIGNVPLLDVVLTQIFGLPDLQGVQFGVARIDVRFVLEPGTTLLVGLGLAATASRRASYGRGVEEAPLSFEVPKPGIVHDNRFLWEGLVQHELLIQRCASCLRLQHPPAPMCR